jgi:ADP-ribose pyrophosphatase
MESEGRKKREANAVAKRVEIIKKKTLFEHFFKIESAMLRYERYDGKMSDKVERLSLERGDAVAAVVHNARNNTVILVEQFRYPAYENGPGWILEIPAGIVEPHKDKTPADTVRRELVEEIGYSVEKLQPISTFYLSPGGSSERVFLYYVRVTPRQKTGEGGGLVSEGENVRIVSMKVDEAFEKVDEGKIVDAKSIVGLQWLKLQR